MSWLDRRLCRAVVLGCSAGGMDAAAALLGQLGPKFRLPLIIVQHRQAGHDEALAHFYSSHTHLAVTEAGEKEKIQKNHLYLAPPDYHLLIEQDETFSLSVEEKVNYCRPSIDVLFESAADVYGFGLAGIILSGANRDGAQGLKRIKEQGGLALVQTPETAQFAEMPHSALRAVQPDHVLSPADMGRLLTKLRSTL
ncbi:CheB methylesterase [Candidatus Electronema halotolerans]